LLLSSGSRLQNQPPPGTNLATDVMNPSTKQRENKEITTSLATRRESGCPELRTPTEKQEFHTWTWQFESEELQLTMRG
jgi:hypothetical protein